MSEATYTLSLFNTATDRVPKPVVETFSDLVSRLTTHNPIDVKITDDPTVMVERLDAAKKSIPGFSPCSYREGTTRAKANVEHLFAFVADIDDGTPLADLEPLWVNAAGEPLAYIWYTTFKSRADKPRIRIFFLLAASVAAADWPDTWRRLSDALTAGHNDENTKDASRLHFLPACPVAWVSEADCGYREGALVNPADYPAVGSDPRPRDVPPATGPGIFATHTTYQSGQPIEWDFDKDGDPLADDDAAVRLMGRMKNGAKFDSLMRGSLAYHGGDESRADFSLASMIAWVVGDDPARIERIFGRSQLAERGKWKERADYRSLTIGEAIAIGGGKFFDLAGWVKKRREAERRDKEREDRESKLRDTEATVEAMAGSGPLPKIYAKGQQDSAIMAAGWRAIKRVNHDTPRLLAMGGKSAAPRVVLLNHSQEGNPYTIDCSPNVLGNALRRCAHWVALREATATKPAADVSVPVPTKLVEAMLVDYDGIAESLPNLAGIASSPVLTPRGDLLVANGYDRDTGLYIACPLVNVPKNPSSGDAQAALERLKKPWGDFPMDASDRAGLIAMTIQPFVRHYIGGPAPMYVVEAPVAGTGKTLLAATSLGLSTPGMAVSAAPSERERGAAEEWEKLLGSVFASSPSVVLFDNVHGKVESGTLENLLTGSTAQLRVLGSSTVREVNMAGVTLAMTANNITMSRDTARRCTFIRLDAGVENPEERTGFTIDDLRQYITDHRAELLSEVVTILAAWIAAGRPESKVRKGSFERWSAIMGGILEFVGVEGFLARDKEAATEADTDGQAWSGFVTAWAQRFPDHAVTAKQLCTDTGTNAAGFIASIPGLAIEHELVADNPGASKSLGKKLQAMKGRVIAGYRIVGIPGHGGVTRWGVKRVVGLDGFEGFSAATRTQENQEANQEANIPVAEEPTKNPRNPPNPPGDYEEAQL